MDLLATRISAVSCLFLCAACTFPEVNFSHDASLDDATLDASDKDQASDVVAIIDSPIDPDAASCDRDYDGYRSKACDGGDDCDDLDKRAHPNADFREEIGVPPTNGDWNCNGTVEKLYLPANCSGFSTNCTAILGFAADEACGATGPYVQCTQAVITCGQADAGIRKQGCK